MNDWETGDDKGKEPTAAQRKQATKEIRSRWGGRMMKHPVTGEDVPDPLDRVIIYKYLNPRAEKWPEADYIVFGQMEMPQLQ
jgi:hypothetical protein